jgi:hypothetical protein
MALSDDESSVASDAFGKELEEVGVGDFPNTFGSPSSSKNGSGGKKFPPHTPPRRQHVLGDVSPLIGGASRLALTQKCFIPVDWLLHQDGSKSNPWIVEHESERGKPSRDFDIQYVENMEDANMFTRRGYHIRRTVAVPDCDRWFATVPHDIPQNYARRCVLFEGPARDWWQGDTEKYHASGNVGCDATRKAHTGTEILIEKTPSLQSVFYLVCFPPNVELNNQIFSSEEYTLELGQNPMKSPAAENDFDIDLCSMVLFWRIAIRGGIQVGKMGGKKKKANMFKA